MKTFAPGTRIELGDIIVLLTASPDAWTPSSEGVPRGESDVAARMDRHDRGMILAVLFYDQSMRYLILTDKGGLGWKWGELGMNRI